MPAFIELPKRYQEETDFLLNSVVTESDTENTNEEIVSDWGIEKWIFIIQNSLSKIKYFCLFQIHYFLPYYSGLKKNHWWNNGCLW